MTNNKNAKTAKNSSLELRQRTVGTWSVNAYGYVCIETGESVLIDPGGEPDTLEEMLEGSRPVAILITHSHPDHTGVLQTMRDKLSVPVMAHAGSPDAPSRITADRWLEHGDSLAVGSHRLNIVHTPGHTTDQICFFPQNDFRVVVGDTIFDGGPGKTWSSQDFQQTLKTLREIILSWPDQTVCFPGHGASFELGAVRPAIQTFLEKDHGDFYGDAVW